jgi:hypothetical protein
MRHQGFYQSQATSVSQKLLARNEGLTQCNPGRVGGPRILPGEDARHKILLFSVFYIHGALQIVQQNA